MVKIEIKVSDDLILDAGAVEEVPAQFVIRPPETPMIEQLIAYLEDKPYHYSDVQTRHMAVGFTALCVRWGSYLSTLMDATTDLHPAIPGFHKEQPDEYSFISNGEMKRLNIEISHNIYRLVQFFRERGDHEFWSLLSKAHEYLPMPHQQVPMNRKGVNAIYTGLATGMMIVGTVESRELREQPGNSSNGSAASSLHRVTPENADRVLANVLTCQAWRSSIIEEIHGGKAPKEGLRPHQQRFNRRNQLAVMREVTANLGSVLFTLNTVFDPNYETSPMLPNWPQTATAMANSFYGISSSSWSVADASSLITLPRQIQVA